MFVVLLITAVESGFTWAAAAPDQSSTKATATGRRRREVFIVAGGYPGLVAYAPRSVSASAEWTMKRVGVGGALVRRDDDR
jgi:hypothetical protein